jgi:hypothetical protein
MLEEREEFIQERLRINNILQNSSDDLISVSNKRGITSFILQNQNRMMSARKLPE